MLDLIKNLCALDGISGRESAVRDYIISQIKDYATDIMVDPLGNLLVYKKGAKEGNKRVLLDAHMDEVGFVITSINSDGTLNFECVGGISTGVMLGRAVTVGESKINGVIGVVPVHLLPADKKAELPDVKSLCIDIGAKSKEDAETLVKAGDMACFQSEFVTYGDGYIKCKALDDRAGCAILIEMIKSDLPVDLYFSFSVGEEVGMGMAGTGIYIVEPDYSIVVETTTAADLAGVDEHKTVCRLGGGGVVSFMDRRTVYDKKLFDRAFEIAKEKNILLQTKSMVAGGNNAGVIHTSVGGVKTVAVSLPCRYLHSPSCVIKSSDVIETQKIIAALSEELAND